MRTEALSRTLTGRSLQLVNTMAGNLWGMVRFTPMSGLDPGSLYSGKPNVPTSDNFHRYFTAAIARNPPHAHMVSEELNSNSSS